ncbi:hypothetical protein [uncultured Reyranella sp.]|uniref:hypothetical protein n=1 Tax=uncultured Reyranella sp. TaxID=735512 RepID=UPI0025D60AE9|nr:hypothetical protein [uncultured Reyranella sp.]
MASRAERQRFIRHYKDVTGEREVDMHKVAEFAQAMGWKMPTPQSAVDMLATQFVDAARDETKRSSKTGRPYRVYHAVPAQGNLFVYVDIDEATRPQMLKSSVQRREQMVSDGVNLTDDTDHWNAMNPDKEPIQLPMDLTLDIQIRKAADEQDDDEGSGGGAAEAA